MIEVREIKPPGKSKEWIIAIDSKTSVVYYTTEEAKQIRKRLNEIFEGDEE